MNTKMNVQIIEHEKTSLQVLIKCPKINDEILRLKTHVELFAQKLQTKKDNKFYFINACDVLYFESVDNRTFAYTEKDVLEVNHRLYELEAIFSDKDFIRISKSSIVNINKIYSLKPELNRTISATMCNGELLHISRNYVRTIRKILSI